MVVQATSESISDDGNFVKVTLILHYFDINCSQPKLTFEHNLRILCVSWKVTWTGCPIFSVITEWANGGDLCCHSSSAYINLQGVSAALVHRNLYKKGSLIPSLLQKSTKFSYLWFRSVWTLQKDFWRCKYCFDDVYSTSLFPVPKFEYAQTLFLIWMPEISTDCLKFLVTGQFQLTYRN